jgi:hypothetical protein
MPSGECATAYLLHNGPASYVCGKVKPIGEAVGKPSLNRAIEWQGVDPKPGDLSLGRLKRG